MGDPIARQTAPGPMPLEEPTALRIRADFGERVVVRPGDVEWVASPTAGIERRMLDRIGAEVARATSFVRYAARSHFPPHVHGGGEEFIVLEGVFADERGRYPPGFYVRNPPGSRHGPFTEEGCTIFVKLWQIDPADTAQVVVDTPHVTWRQGSGPRVLHLDVHRFRSERVWLERWEPGTSIGTREQGE